MKNNIKKLGVSLSVVFLMTIFAGAVQAQWALIKSDNDNEGKEIIVKSDMITDQPAR